jgi:hypothetical protein
VETEVNEHDIKLDFINFIYFIPNKLKFIPTPVANFATENKNSYWQAGRGCTFG